MMLENRNVAITGASSGIGLEILRLLLENGCRPLWRTAFHSRKVLLPGKKLNTISKIYVSTMESVANGRANWGIPKTKADFSFVQTGKDTETATVTVDGKTAAQFTMRTGKLSFPVSTKLLPFPLVQKYEGKYFFTNFYGKGKGHPAGIADMKIDPALFPDVASCRPIAVIRVDPFEITFPKAEIREEE